MTKQTGATKYKYICNMRKVVTRERYPVSVIYYIKTEYTSIRFFFHQTWAVNLVNSVIFGENAQFYARSKFQTVFGNGNLKV